MLPSHIKYQIKNRFKNAFFLLVIALLAFNYNANTCAAEQPEKSAALPQGALYSPAKNSRVAVILFHSRNGHPADSFNAYLHREINQQLGYHTLALKLPNENIIWYEYEKFFPDVLKMTHQAITFLMQQHKVTKIYFVARGMGVRFASAYLAHYDAGPVAGFVGITMRNRGMGNLNPVANLLAMTHKIPVLDIFGNAGKIKYEHHADERLMIFSKITNYTQVSIPNAGSAFKRHRQELMYILSRWLMARTNQTYH